MRTHDNLMMSPTRVIEMRRLDIIRRKLRGETIHIIAHALGVSVPTIVSDLKAIRSMNGELVKDFDQETYVGETLATYKKIEEEAWVQVFALDIGDSRKAKFLDSIRATRKEAVSLLQSSGLLHKEAEKVEVQLTANVISDWSDEQKLLIADAVVEAAIIDVEATSSPKDFNSLPAPEENLELEDIAEFLEDLDDE
jgi:hypothetical protein